LDNFKSIPVESDTKIISEQEIQVANLPALHQNWSWDGIAAESIIFHTEDVKDCSDEELFEKVKCYCIQKNTIAFNEQYTIKRDSPGFTFVNYNFLTADDFL